MKELNTQNLWSSELGTQEGINVPIWSIVDFQQRYRKDSQSFNNDTIYGPPDTFYIKCSMHYWEQKKILIQLIY